MFEGKRDTWLRWTDAAGKLIPTGKERAEEERRRADEAEKRVEQLMALLRRSGIDPDAP